MAAPPRLHLVTASFPDRPAYDVAVSHAILRRVATGERPPTLRIGRPGAMVAFGRMDAVSPRYAEAVRAAVAAGFAAVERLAGGRAAVFHEGTIAFAHATPDPAPRERTHVRFRETADLVAAALRRLGVDARVGEVAGEYCPGGYSVNARGQAKVMGIGQRLLSAGAAHVGGVLVVSGSERVRSVLVPVYAALGLRWDPATAGSVEDEVGPVSLDDAAAALRAEYAARHAVVEDSLDQATLELAERLEAEHRSPEPGPTPRAAA